MVDPSPQGGHVSRRAFVAGTLAVTAAACSTGADHRAAAVSTTAKALSSASTAPTPTGPAGFVSHGPRTRPEVALTFHLSGDRGLVGQLLSSLTTHQVVATVFVVGSWLDAHPEVVGLLQQQGHELANHTYTHPTFHTLSPTGMASEITKCRDTLERLGRTAGSFFRPSGTSNGVDPPGTAALTAAGEAGYATVVGFDVDPGDYADPGRDLVVQRTLAAARPGSIISLHFGHQGTIDALPDILTTLRGRGLKTVSTSTLLRA